MFLKTWYIDGVRFADVLNKADCYDLPYLTDEGSNYVYFLKKAYAKRISRALKLVDCQVIRKDIKLNTEY